jgi:hypothetical protein
MPPTPPLLTPEFDRLLDRLAADIIDAAVFRHLRADLNAILDDYRREFNESNTFWYLSFQAYTEVMLNRLGRVYVSHKGALSLSAWLEAIRSTPQLFPTAPDRAQLGRDVESVGNTDPLVKKLICLRGNFVAHINWDHTAGGGVKIKNESFALTFDEIDVLILRASEILNRYSILFKQMLWSMEIAGRHDYKFILNAVRSDLERLDAEIASDIERATRSSQIQPVSVDVEPDADE